MRLSKNFLLSEFLVTDAGLDNTPNKKQWERLVNTANKMEMVRAALGNIPITPSSVFRSAAVNTRIGGSKTSAHLDGDAVDFAINGKTNEQIIKAILKSGVEFDQLINENKGASHWVHISFAPALRGQVLHYDGHTYSLIQTVKW